MSRKILFVMFIWFCFTFACSAEAQQPNMRMLTRQEASQPRQSNKQPVAKPVKIVKVGEETRLTTIAGGSVEATGDNRFVVIALEFEPSMNPVLAVDLLLLTSSDQEFHSAGLGDGRGNGRYCMDPILKLTRRIWENNQYFDGGCAGREGRQVTFDTFTTNKPVAFFVVPNSVPSRDLVLRYKGALSKLDLKYAPASGQRPPGATIATKAGELSIRQVQESDRFPPGCATPRTVGCDQVMPGYKIVVIWLQASDSTKEDAIMRSMWTSFKDIQIVADDGSKTKAYKGGQTFWDAAGEGLFIAFTPPASSRVRSLAWPGNPLIEINAFAQQPALLVPRAPASQPDGATPEVSVDVKTVTLPKKAVIETSALPKPAAELQAGAFKYKASIAMGTQSIPLSLKTEIKEENGAWIVSETANTPQGEMVDISTIEKGSLLLQHRSIKGALALELDVKGNKASGTVTVNGQTKPIDVDLGGTVFADGAGAFDVIAALPLTEGYSLGFRNFDVQKLKPRLKQLKVVGAEIVTVPAGKFDAYKVEITSADDDAERQTVWIAKETRQVVKITAVLPSLNGAVLTSELTP